MNLLKHLHPSENNQNNEAIMELITNGIWKDILKLHRGLIVAHSFTSMGAALNSTAVQDSDTP